MSRANIYLTETSKQLFQYSKHGNSSRTIGNTEQILQPGIYKLNVSMDGQAIYTKSEVKSDSLINLRNKKRQEVLSEFKKFWTGEVKTKFEKLGLIHKRGFIYEGPPGTGKSCDLKLIMNEMVAAGDVVFIADEASTLVECLKQFKEVEADRHVAVVMEDFERMADWGEHILLELLDGPNAVGGVFYLATTNHIKRISERLKRKSRFDRILHVGLPEFEDRLEYLRNKLEGVDNDANIQYLAQKTDGKNFADLKDVVVAIYCLGNSLEEVLLEMRNGSLEETGSKLTAIQLDQKLKESIQKRQNVSQLNEGLSMSEKTRAQRFLEVYGLDRKPLANHDQASPREPSKKAQDAMAVPAKPTTPAGLMPNELPDGQEPVDGKRVMLQMNQRLDLLNIKGISIGDVDCDEDGTIMVGFSDEHGNEMEAEFMYDENDQACVCVGEYETPLGNQMPGAITTPSGKYINLYDPGFLDKETMLAILTQGGLMPTKDRTVNVGKDAFGNRLPIPPGN